ncbi:GNAT family N-acetyltransferase [Paracoccus salsus]|uniref:GNAT family N-acetyltransferase n=1 Tax=Paracoccus salsus TaxID=2911061 RepID=UPI001F26D9D6|nr:GNAT family N-acetyltransferase [Paracoccus salsus]MCF3974046.1 GNAT family N-acetyltransferase [Paracoccus salsus]
MSCACGHHHPRLPDSRDPSGTPIELARPMVALSGRLICADARQMMAALSLLPDHVELSRAEPGNLRFDLWQDEDPLIWHLAELFRDAEAFAAHQHRTADSAWGRDGGDLGRDLEQREVMPAIRAEQRGDRDAIDRLLRETFDGKDEARLVRGLRDQGDLTLSLVAEAAGTILGQVALSPLTGERPALALAPLAVAAGARGLGIGTALVREAIARAEGTPVVVLGDPGYYARFGFEPAELASPYAGPHLLVLGQLPRGAAIGHAPAFAAL